MASLRNSLRQIISLLAWEDSNFPIKFNKNIELSYLTSSAFFTNTTTLLTTLETFKTENQDPKLYLPFTRIEIFVPWVFFVIHLFVLLRCIPISVIIQKFESLLC
ncbi:MAG: hypothetical protein KAV87_34060 [Desulfobacteraceae bacterium]|nr:hypothetical protein [Desulfobacteraceae bacterium]